ncbi:6-carboxytetrahydropterin synthase [Geobacillus sp. G4]|uniref:6-carboxytetrahydropterin synthase n=1 Tax=Geobacillus TaxID=129337 RepID=UPI00059D9EA7|nr:MULTISPECIES: 6-carboxytetrahydropterin synthase [Geobacillus]AMV10709.1 6-pyruvoyl tetrahydropterin synthase [Geobacillus thermoleovorans]TRY43578.1 6-pyruvoyl tetrahydropterin synthase [Geobacillus sp. LEMMJ02]UPT59182.1 6-pyruvoyl tetrahydropterin synthase [Geobacillus thermoleovorans]WMJ21305.1 6-carboxytetrahydropterin synthase [Geobacillus kaustophilus]
MLYLTRTIAFSAAHRYWIEDWSVEKNKAVFGLCSNLNGHGHDYQLDVTVKGLVNPLTGIVVNITQVDAIMKEVVSAELDGKFLNQEHPYFQTHIPTTEMMVTYIWDVLQGKFSCCQLCKVKLQENETLYAVKEEQELVQLTRRYYFSSAHRLHSDQLTNEENQRLFGKCNNRYGHGHNYCLEVTVIGKPDPITGMVVNLAELDEIVNREVLVKFDHKHLNLDTDEFKQINPTAENIVIVIWELLAPHLSSLYKIGLWETQKNYFEYFGPHKEK